MMRNSCVKPFATFLPSAISIHIRWLCIAAMGVSRSTKGTPSVGEKMDKCHFHSGGHFLIAVETLSKMKRNGKKAQKLPCGREEIFTCSNTILSTLFCRQKLCQCALKCQVRPPISSKLF